MRNLKLKKLLNLSSVLAISLSVIGFMGGGASAASVTETNVITSSWQGYYTDNPECDTAYGANAIICSTQHSPGISNQWPINFSDLASGGGFWHFGPEDSKYIGNQSLLDTEIPGGRRFEHLRFSSSPDCKLSRSITAATYKFSMRINSNGPGSYDNNGFIWLGLWDMNDPDNPAILDDPIELSKNDIGTVFEDYTFTIPATALPMSLEDLNKRYDLNVMYESAGAASGKTLSIDMDEVSREVTYDSSSSNCSPTISTSSTTTIPSTTASGTQVVSGSSLSASDPDGNTLAYSITAGNGGGYFTINTSTGDISTTQVNIPAGTYTLTVQVDDGNGGTATSTVTIVVTDGSSPTPTSYCPSPGSTTQALSPTGDCDNDGITNQEEGYDPDGDGNPTTGTSSIDTDKDGTPDYIDTDSDNDKLTDKQEGTKDTNNNKIPDFRDPTKTLANTGTSLNLILSLSALAIVAGFGLKKLRG